MRLKYIFIKRFIDIIAAYILLSVCYIPMIIIAIAIKISDGGPVIFRQIRIGLYGKRFVCYKFRTMRCDAPREMSTKEFTNAGEYITPVGAFLRRTSLDELPQLFNVLAGEMSLVGPRPLIPNEKEIHELRKNFGVYNVRPGITGLAQVCGRDRLGDLRKVECDAIYASNSSFFCDMYIVLATVIGVLRRDGINDLSKTAP